jgi:hypothetical protein
MMRRRCHLWVLAAAVAGLTLGWGGVSVAGLVPEDTVAHDVVVREVSAGADGVSGMVVNRSDKTVRNVQLLIRHSFVWRNERHPGSDSPGESYFTTVPNDIPPGSSARFVYRPSTSLPTGESGHFDTAVEVMGFTEVVAVGSDRSQEGATIYRESETSRGSGR